MYLFTHLLQSAYSPEVVGAADFVSGHLPAVRQLAGDGISRRCIDGISRTSRWIHGIPRRWILPPLRWTPGIGRGGGGAGRRLGRSTAPPPLATSLATSMATSMATSLGGTFRRVGLAEAPQQATRHIVRRVGGRVGGVRHGNGRVGRWHRQGARPHVRHGDEQRGAALARGPPLVISSPPVLCFQLELQRDQTRLVGVQYRCRRCRRCRRYRRCDRCDRGGRCDSCVTAVVGVVGVIGVIGVTGAVGVS